MCGRAFVEGREKRSWWKKQRVEVVGSAGGAASERGAARATM